MPILAVLFGFLSLNTAALLFLAVYILITLSDLDCDYLNPTACSAKLNKWIIPEMISYGINVLIIAFAGRFILVMLNLPMLIYVIYSFFFSVPRKSMGFYDPSEIYLHGKLKTHIKFASIRLIFHLTHFFIYLYIFIISLLTSV